MAATSCASRAAARSPTRAIATDSERRMRWWSRRFTARIFMTATAAFAQRAMNGDVSEVVNRATDRRNGSGTRRSRRRRTKKVSSRASTSARTRTTRCCRETGEGLPTDSMKVPLTHVEAVAVASGGRKRKKPSEATAVQQNERTEREPRPSPPLHEPSGDVAADSAHSRCHRRSADLAAAAATLPKPGGGAEAAGKQVREEAAPTSEEPRRRHHRRATYLQLVRETFDAGRGQIPEWFNTCYPHTQRRNPPRLARALGQGSTCSRTAGSAATSAGKPCSRLATASSKWSRSRTQGAALGEHPAARQGRLVVGELRNRKSLARRLRHHRLQLACSHADGKLELVSVTRRLAKIGGRGRRVRYVANPVERRLRERRALPARPSPTNPSPRGRADQDRRWRRGRTFVCTTAPEGRKPDRLARSSSTSTPPAAAAVPPLQLAHRPLVLLAHPEQLAALAALVELVLALQDLPRHAPLHLRRCERRPGGAVADAAAQRLQRARVDRRAQPEHLQHLMNCASASSASSA